MTFFCPVLTTDRLILRPFTTADFGTIFEIFSDETVNIYLPWFPIRTIEEAQLLCKARYAHFDGLRYAICLKKNDLPIGYVHVETAPSFDLGYGLKKEFWRQGIVSEACRAIIRQAKACGVPYLTATHDRNNPHSGFVMRALGMRYRYSYEEMWQPKNFPVIFRLHQLDLDAPHADYPEYRARYENHFVEYELRHNDDLHFSQLLI